MNKPNEVAEALRDVFISPNEADRNLEAANVVDGLFAIARAINHLASVVDEGLNVSLFGPLAVEVKEKK